MKANGAPVPAGRKRQGAQAGNTNATAGADIAAAKLLGHHGNAGVTPQAFALLAWASVGVIFGDIATSPLYVYVTIFSDLGVDTPQKADVLGAASLIVWTLTLEVLLKYCFVVLRADDKGQGGAFALYSLLCRHIGIAPHCTTPWSTRRRGQKPAAAAALHATHNRYDSGTDSAARSQSNPAQGGLQTILATPNAAAAEDDANDASGGGSPLPWWRRCSADGERLRRAIRRSVPLQLALWAVAVAATGMLIGDGVLTPSLTVLSAVSGLSVAVPSLSQELIVGVAIAVLFCVFALQPLGTGKVGVLFAPTIAVWLLSLAAINSYNIAINGADVFQALSPHHIVPYFARHGATAWRSLGAVMLCITGAEALFADLGHFSRGSITAAFSMLAYPCLLLTYLGQAAHLMAHPEDTDVFWKSTPRKLLYPMLALATAASVVASQALLSGVFSILRQATILGAFPPVRIIHTGGTTPGAQTQVYIPLANGLLLALCCAVVAGFRDTVALGQAYGLTVMTDIVITTSLITLVMVVVWEASLFLVVPFAAFYWTVELAFWSANVIKVPQGGWFSLAVAAVAATAMLVWWAGSRRMAARVARAAAGTRILLVGAPTTAATEPSATALTPTPATMAAVLPHLMHDPALPATALPTTTSSLSARRSWPMAAPATGSTALAVEPPRDATWPAPAPVQGPVPAGGPGSSTRGLLSIRSALQRLSLRAASRGPSLRQRFRASASGDLAEGLAPLVPVAATAAAAAAGPPTAAAPQPPPCYQQQRQMFDPLLLDPDKVGLDPGTLVLELPGARMAQPFSRSNTLQSSAAGAGQRGSLGLVREEDSEAWAAGGGKRPEGASGLPTTGADDKVDGGRPGHGVDLEAGRGSGEAVPLPPVLLPLGRLPGIGVYYVDEQADVAGSGAAPSLPPVLVHFLRNVQAVHRVAVFLAVRRLPTPHVPRARRLHVHAPLAAVVPNFYQVVALYGYLDNVELGEAFLSELLGAVQRRLLAAGRSTGARLDLNGAPLRGGGGTGGAGRSSTCSGKSGSAGAGSASVKSVGAVSGVSLAAASAGGGVQGSTQGTRTDNEIQPAGGAVGRAFGVMAPEAVGPGGRAQLMHRRGERRGRDRGGEDGGYSTADDRADVDDEEEEDDDGDDVWLGRQRDTAARPSAAASSLGTEAEAEAEAQAEAVRALVESTIAEYLEAQLHGVVYYASRPLLRSPAALFTGAGTAATPAAGATIGAGGDAKRSRVGAAVELLRRMWRWVVYGHLYRWLTMLSWYDMEQWQVPYDRLVELGMFVDLA